MTRSGYSVRSSHVKRSTCHPASAIAFCRLAVLVEVVAVAVEGEAVYLYRDLLLRKADVDLVSGDGVVRFPASDLRGPQQPDEQSLGFATGRRLSAACRQSTRGG